MEDRGAAGFNGGKNTDFWILREETVIPTHVAFEAKTRREIETFYDAALATGALGNGGPGHQNDSPDHYAALVYDPEGHDIEAVWYDYSRAG